MDKKLRIGDKLKPSNHELYHISFDKNLKVLTPRLPAGDSDGGEFKEPDIPRVSLSPSPELCFRAVYANIRHLLEGIEEDSITFTLYKAVSFNKRELHNPTELIAKQWVHDAHITLEHFVTGNVKLKSMGKVTFKNTSDGEGLTYKPFTTEKARYHSPKEIVVL